MTRRAILLLSGTLLLWGASACRPSAPSETTLQMWAMGSEGEQVQRLLGAFTESNRVRVHVQQIPWSAAHEKLLTAYVAGTLPDVVQIGNTWVPELTAMGALASLDERLGGADLRADTFPGIWDTNVIDGATYALPWYVDTRVLFYRRDLLSQAGYRDVPPTWSDWLQAMQVIRQQAHGARYGLLAPLSEWQLPVALAFQCGAELLREDGQYGAFRSPEFRRAFTFFVDLFGHNLAPFSGESQVANVYQDFASGFFVFYLSGPWNLGEFRRHLPAQLDATWATAPLPAPDAARPGVSIAGGASLAITRASRHAREAWQLLQYLSAPAQQIAFYDLTGDLPARRSAWTDPRLRDNARAQAFWIQLQNVRATPKIPEWERIADLITRYSEAAVRGQRSIDAALEGLDADTDAVLEKRRWMLRRKSNGERQASTQLHPSRRPQNDAAFSGWAESLS